MQKVQKIRIHHSFFFLHFLSLKIAVLRMLSSLVPMWRCLFTCKNTECRCSFTSFNGRIVCNWASCLSRQPSSEVSFHTDNLHFRILSISPKFDPWSVCHRFYFYGFSSDICLHFNIPIFFCNISEGIFHNPKKNMNFFFNCVVFWLYQLIKHFFFQHVYALKSLFQNELLSMLI